MSEDKGKVHDRLRNLWLLLCMMGTSYQAYILCESYLSYEISTAVEIAFPTTFDPPAFSICFVILNVINWNKTEVDLPDLRARINITKPGGVPVTELPEFLSIISKMRFDDKMLKQAKFVEGLKVQDAFKYTLDAKDLFGWCRIVEGEDYRQLLTNCSDIYNIVEFFKTGQKCFGFWLKKPVTYHYLKLQRQKGIPGFENMVRLHPAVINMTTDVTICYHDQNTYPREGFTRFVFLTNLAQLFSLAYATIHSEALPAPYETDCRDYNESGFTDRGDCYETCFNKLSLERLGKLAPGPVHQLEEFSQEMMMSVTTANFNPDAHAAIMKIDDDCDDVCARQDCKQRYYIPQIRSSVPFQASVIINYVEQVPGTNTVYSQKLGFIAFLTDLFSTPGFWLGTSGLSVFDQFWELSANRKTKKRSKKGNKKNKKQQFPISANGDSLKGSDTVRRLQRDVGTVKDNINSMAGYLYDSHTANLALERHSSGSNYNTKFSMMPYDTQLVKRVRNGGAVRQYLK